MSNIHDLVWMGDSESLAALLQNSPEQLEVIEVAQHSMLQLTNGWIIRKD